VLRTLKGLFSGSPRNKPDSGLYLYVRLEKTGEIARLRLAPDHELNWDEEAGNFVSRKTIIGPLTFARADAEFRFDNAKTLISGEIDGGEIVTEEAWQEQTGSQGDTSGAS